MAAATEYATKVAAHNDHFSWEELETQAFSPYPALVALIADSTHELATKPHRTRARDAAMVFRALFGLMVLFAPLEVCALLIIGQRIDAFGPFLIMASALAVAHIVLRFMEWYGGSRDFESVAPSAVVLAGISAAFGVLACALAAFAALVTLDAGIWIAFSLFVLMTASCVITVVVMRRRIRSASGDRGRLNPFGAVQQGVALLPTVEREALKHDLSSALDILVDAGIITPAERATAVQIPLGGLVRWQWTLAQRRRQSERSAQTSRSANETD